MTKYEDIFTVLNSSYGKVMFSQACVKNSVPPLADTPLADIPGQTPPPPPPRDGLCSGRDAS